MIFPNLIVFTDLDGTLLDAKTYDFQAALPAINELKSSQVPLIFCSSKTRAEIELLRRDLGIDAPFIVENGGAIYVPIHIYHEDVSRPFFSPAGGEDKGEGEFPHATKQRGNYYLIEFGRPYEELRQALQAISRQVGLELKGFGDMTVEEISRLTGLSTGEAKLASQREYDEPFIMPKGEAIIDNIQAKAADIELTVLQGGQFGHLIGGTDKGQACQVLINSYRQQRGSVVTAAFGDSLNDVAMLSAVDHPFLVEKKGGGHQKGITLDRLIYMRGEGPVGWTRGVWHLLKRIGQSK